MPQRNYIALLIYVNYTYIHTYVYTYECILYLKSKYMKLETQFLMVSSGGKENTIREEIIETSALPVWFFYL